MSIKVKMKLLDGSKPLKEIKDKPLRFPVKLYLNAVEIILVDKLIDYGLYGYSRNNVVRSLVDRELEQIFINRKKQ